MNVHPVVCHLQVLLKNSGALPLRLDMSPEMFRLCSSLRKGKLDNLIGLLLHLSVSASEIPGSEIFKILTRVQFSV